jgi:cytochrome b involved in lipid metabolism
LFLIKFGHHTIRTPPTTGLATTEMSTAGPTHPTPNPPRNDPITTKELSLHNGQDPSKPIWVAVKGTVFDVSRNKDAYGTIPAIRVSFL